jgi:hypothetical protein
MSTSLSLRSSTGKRATIPRKRISASTREELLEEVRQLRAAMSIYQHLVNRLLTEHAPSRVGKRERNSALASRSAVSKNLAVALNLSSNAPVGRQIQDLHNLR